MGGCWENKSWDFARTEMTKEDIFCELREKGGRIPNKKNSFGYHFGWTMYCCKDIYYKR